VVEVLEGHVFVPFVVGLVLDDPSEEDFLPREGSLLALLVAQND